MIASTQVASRIHHHNGHASPSRTQRQRINVGDSERLLSIAGGAALAATGLLRSSPTGLAVATVGGALIYRGLSGHCPVYEALDTGTAPRHGQAIGVRSGHGFKVEERIVINRDPSVLYATWRNVENIGRMMQHLKRVEALDDRRSHWVAQGPLRIKPSWDAEIITDRENEVIAWRSLPGGAVDTAGSVHFRELPHGRGTEVRVVFKYDAPGGAAGAAIARLLGASPRTEVREDLRCFKRLMETGELPTTSGQPHGQCR
jgi:uncharacterized membrane protein